MDQLIAGFVIRGAGTRTVLIRAVGPTLTEFKVPGVLPSPSLSLVHGDQVLATSEAWDGVEAAWSFRLPDFSESPSASAPNEPISRHRLIALSGWLEASVRLD